MIKKTPKGEGRAKDGFTFEGQRARGKGNAQETSVAPEVPEDLQYVELLNELAYYVLGASQKDFVVDRDRVFVSKKGVPYEELMNPALRTEDFYWHIDGTEELPKKFFDHYSISTNAHLDEGPQKIKNLPEFLQRYSIPTALSKPMYRAGGLRACLEVVKKGLQEFAFTKNPKMVFVFPAVSLVRQDGLYMLCAQYSTGLKRFTVFLRDISFPAPEMLYAVLYEEV